MMLLTSVSAWAQFQGTPATGEDGLTVTNVRNAVPGYTGSFDVYYEQTFVPRDLQFDVTLPEGLTYASYAAGDLLDDHTVTASDQGSNITRFTLHSLGGKMLKGASGTLLTVYFTVSATATGTQDANITNFLRTNEAAQTNSGNPDHDFTVPVGNTVILADDDTGIPASASNVNVNVQRTLAADKWNTICLPFAMTAEQVAAAFGTDAKLGDFAGYTVNGGNIRVSFTTATAIAANHPYLLKVTSEVPGFTVEGVDIVSPTTSPMVNYGDDATDDHIKAMIGVYQEMTLPAYRLYIKDNTFKYSNGTSRLMPYRAYFHFCDFNADNHACSFVLDDEFTTSIGDAIRLDGNGIDNSPEGLYDLNGRKWSNSKSSDRKLPKGVYIQDGNKIIMK